MTVQLFRVILPVSDIEAAARFYGAVLGMPGNCVSPGRHCFDCDGTILACFDPAADGDDYTSSPNPEELYFVVDDIDATYNAARNAGALPESGVLADAPLSEVHLRSWGETSFYVRDPFGNRLCLVCRKTKFTG